jgi:hypothetical protein
MHDPWWSYGLDFVVAFVAGIAADRWLIWRAKPAQSARPYDLYEDVIVKLRFDGALTKAQQHEQCQRIWDAARG